MTPQAEVTALGRKSRNQRESWRQSDRICNGMLFTEVEGTLMYLYAEKDRQKEQFSRNSILISPYCRELNENSIMKQPTDVRGKRLRLEKTNTLRRSIQFTFVCDSLKNLVVKLLSEPPVCTPLAVRVRKFTLSFPHGLVLVYNTDSYPFCPNTMFKRQPC